MTDTGKYKLLHARDAQGEIGKIPPLPPGCVTLDFFLAMELAAMDTTAAAVAAEAAANRRSRK